MLRCLSFLLVAVALAAASAAQTPDTLGRPVYEIADVQPELAGGMAALSAAAEYPAGALAAGVDGQVVVQFVVDEAGGVLDPVAVRSPSEALSQAAVAAVLRQRFTPGLVDGQPVRVRLTLPITFRMTGPDPAAERLSLLRPSAPSRARPSSERPEVYDEADVQPELVGGLRTLQEAVRYPVEARRRYIQGTVVVGFVVDEAGRPTEITVQQSPHPVLAQAALDAVRSARFTPTLVDGQPVKVRFAVPVSFRLR